MTFALCLQVPQIISSQAHLDIWANFVPSMIFLQSIFGYWSSALSTSGRIDWSQAPTQRPLLFNMLIAMFPVTGNVPLRRSSTAAATVQVVLLLLAAICVPGYY